MTVAVPGEVDDQANRTGHTTAELLGSFYRGLLAEDIPGELAGDLTRLAAEEILSRGLCVSEPRGKVTADAAA